MFKNHSICLKTEKGFTLIELLVVIAIIGILSSVVIPSLGSVREKGKITMIKYTLKNMIAEAEIILSEHGSYSSLCNNTTYSCSGNFAKFCENIIKQGCSVRCFHYNVGGINNWGVTVQVNDLNIFSADNNGLYKWFDVDTSSSATNWNISNLACSSLGGKIPTIGMLTSLYQIYSTTPSGFKPYWYWSSTLHPHTLNHVVDFNMGTGVVSGGNVAGLEYTRCVTPL